MKGYKGFDKDLKCRDLQYEVGKETAVDGDIELCKRGIHFCENPHDIFSYYAPGENNRFAVVEAEDVSDESNGDDSKRVCKRLTVKAEISVFEICRIAVSTFFENFGFKKKIDSADTNNAGDYGAARAGDKGAAQAGYKGAAQAGDYGAAQAGDYGAARAGYKGAAQAGNCGAAQAGDCGAAQAGDYGAAQAGDCGAAIVSNSGRVKGGYGCVLVARNIEYSEETKRYEVADWACAIVDDKEIKSDTWYELSNGKLVESKDQSDDTDKETTA